MLCRHNKIPLSCPLCLQEDEIARLKNDLEDADQAKSIFSDDLERSRVLLAKRDAEIERLKDQLKTKHLHLERQVAKLQEENEHLGRKERSRWRKIIDLELEMNRVRDRAAAWKMCAKRWRGIIRMWPKGHIQAKEIEIQLQNLPSSTEGKSAEEKDSKLGSTEL